MTLERIEQEADRLAGEDSPEAEKLYRLGRRLFDTRYSGSTVSGGDDNREPHRLPPIIHAAVVAENSLVLDLAATARR